MAKIELSKDEVSHLINDTIARILAIKENVFGLFNFGTYISEVEELSEEQKKKLEESGYYSRKELLDKLKKFEQENYPEITCCG